ncbi:YxlC family protein [Thalassobacillus pellis]|uniref:YxlC family protein n=1 Tax=Thalassobacillus pellis TaxID=748008 RepID=UPI001960AFF0|nr:YxlC family protein [Thalassobacillus pellis]MBM7552508.1 Flp pilus assembly protein TadB [Thalassobacillus pellis]
MKNKDPRDSKEYWKKPIVEKIQNTTFQADQKQSVDVPEREWFEDLVRREQKKHRQQLWKDLMLLWAIALIIFTGLTVSVFLLPVFFILVQVAVLFVFCFLYCQEKKRVTEHEQYTTT